MTTFSNALKNSISNDNVVKGKELRQIYNSYPDTMTHEDAFALANWLDKIKKKGATLDPETFMVIADMNPEIIRSRTLQSCLGQEPVDANGLSPESQTLYNALVMTDIIKPITRNSIIFMKNINPLLTRSIMSPALYNDCEDIKTLADLSPEIIGNVISTRSFLHLFNFRNGISAGLTIGLLWAIGGPITTIQIEMI